MLEATLPADRAAARLCRRHRTNGNPRSPPPAAPTRSSPPMREANEETVTEFLAFSTANPSSIRNCFEIARTNARAVRTALTIEMWDAINGAWLELKRYGNGPTLARGVRALPALGAGILAALRRLGLPHHAAQRRLLVLAARRLSSSAPTTPRASSTSNITCCCRRTSRSAARSTISSGRRSCARSRR